MLLEMLLLNEREEAVCHSFRCVLAQSHIEVLRRFGVLCHFYSLSSLLRWQCELNEVPDHDAIGRERAELGCKIFGCSHTLASRALGCSAPLL